MKGKLALLAFLATTVTVGGVYATWTFAENAVPEASTTVNVAMTGVEAITEKGTLSVQIMSAGGFTMAIDDSDNNHLPDLKKEGVVTVTFTPAATAPAEVIANGIDVDFSIAYASKDGTYATLEDWKYADTQIFSISTAPLHLAKGEAQKTEGKFVWTIEAANVAISLGEDFDDVLIDTLAEYNELNDILGKGQFKLLAAEHA